MENWKPITGYEGFYEVSDLGRVRRVSGYVNSGLKHNTKVYRKGGVLKPHIKRNGYLTVDLSKAYEVKTVSVHRLVATAFCEKPNGKEYVNHKNSIRTDNRATNLEWVTASENTLHAAKLGHIGVCNRKPIRCKQLDMTFPSSYEAAQYINQTYFQNSKQTRGMSGKIRACANGLQKTAYGFTWEHYSVGSSTIS